MLVEIWSVVSKDISPFVRFFDISACPFRRDLPCQWSIKYCFTPRKDLCLYKPFFTYNSRPSFPVQPYYSKSRNFFWWRHISSVSCIERVKRTYPPHPPAVEMSTVIFLPSFLSVKVKVLIPIGDHVWKVKVLKQPLDTSEIRNPTADL